MQFHCNGEILLFIFSLQFSTGFRGTAIHCVAALCLISCLVKLFSKLSCTQVQDVILELFFLSVKEKGVFLCMDFGTLMCFDC